MMKNTCWELYYLSWRKMMVDTRREERQQRQWWGLFWQVRATTASSRDGLTGSGHILSSIKPLTNRQNIWDVSPQLDIRHQRVDPRDIRINGNFLASCIRPTPRSGSPAMWQQAKDRYKEESNRKLQMPSKWWICSMKVMCPWTDIDMW